MKHIRLATPEDAQEISGLRIGEFSRSNDFTLLAPQRLNWCETDEINPVLGVWNVENEVVATMRLVRVTHDVNASEVIEADIPEGVEFPAFVFNSAATRKDFRRQGFNQLLRYYAIRSALASGVKSLLSPVYQSAPRIDFMKRLGYVCHDLAHSWQTKLAPKSPRILCVLEEENFSRALDLIRETVPGLLAEYPWQGPSIGS